MYWIVKAVQQGGEEVKTRVLKVKATLEVPMGSCASSHWFLSSREKKISSSAISNILLIKKQQIDWTAGYSYALMPSLMTKHTLKTNCIRLNYKGQFMVRRK